MERLQYATATPTITSGSAYASGNAIGGIMTFAGIVNRGYSAVYSVTIVDKAGQSAAVDLILFSQSFTPTADKSAIAISAADALNVLANIKVLAADYSAIGTPSVATKSQLFFGAVGTLDNNLYGQLISRGTPTYTSTSDLTVKIASEIGVL